jgi:radical SAM protein with 4Fe4S-binding SPASM domain
MADAGVAYVALSGGEPLMRPDIFDIIRRIRERDMTFSIATNATLLTREKAEQLKQLDCLYVQVSLDGATATTHNWFRGRNAFELTLKGIENAVNTGMHVGIAATITQHNYHEVPAMIDLAEQIGAKTFMHYNFVPTGRGKDIVSLDLSPDQREDLLKLLISESKKRKISLLSTACQYSRVCLEQQASHMAMTHFDNSGISLGNPLSCLADFIGGCGTGRLYCALDYDGSITPCVFIRITLGNIRHDSLLDIWHTSDVFAKIRDRENFWGACGACSYRNVCGGCRARAYGYFRDVQAPDVGCVRNREHWEQLKSEASVAVKAQ